ncbi:MAG: hypothetical protein HY537_01890 [Deltaproteobacteria bacterium]|nr:hypothetical protein [Deltaproteobacteria bacterium]
MQIPPDQSFIDPSIHFAISFAQNLGVAVDRLNGLRGVFTSALTQLMDCNREGESDSPILLDVFEEDGRLVIELINRGVPIFTQGSTLSRLQEASQQMDRLSIENLGASGQRLVIEMNLGSMATQRSVEKLGLPEKTNGFDEQNIELCELICGQEKKLTELFYFVYGYNYINEAIYYPEKIRAMWESGKLISIAAALPDGRLAGHVGLMKSNENPLVYEPCFGIVHPGIKSHGLFSRLFGRAMDKLHQLPMDYCVFDCVTNLDFSQRLVSRAGACDLALFVGSQGSQTQAKLSRLGIGSDPHVSDRYSILYSIITGSLNPFGKQIHLPESLGEMLGFLLMPFGMTWNPTPRINSLPREGHYKTSFQPRQNAVLFDLMKPGRRALASILDEWKELLRNGYRYGAVELSVQEPGLDHVYDLLAEQGFFVAGFIPYHLSRSLGVRFQSMGPTHIDFDEIKVFSKTAKKLHGVVERDYQRNHLL